MRTRFLKIHGKKFYGTKENLTTTHFRKEKQGYNYFIHSKIHGVSLLI